MGRIADPSLSMPVRSARGGSVFVHDARARRQGRIGDPSYRHSESRSETAQVDINGLLVIDKPGGITSRDVVNRAQRWFPRGTRIGHAGTLDPLATGVLVLCVGAATRLTEYVQAMPKVYHAGIILGATSDTDDADGTITPIPDASPPTLEQIDLAFASFVGKIEQVPPAYSAAKVTGRRAYDLARKGKDFDLAPRVVEVHGIDVVTHRHPHLEVLVHCGKGTYIRSLARDLGAKLGCGGYIASLRRLAIGSFTEAEALSPDVDADTARSRLLPCWRAVQEWPPMVLPAEDLVKLQHGNRVATPLASGNVLAVADEAGRTVAIVEAVNGWLQPLKVLVH